MNRYTRYFSLLFSISLFFVAAAHAKVSVAPYYSFNFTGAAAIPNKGEMMFPINMVNDLGLIVKPSEKNSLMGFYELKYTGPGLHRWEGKPFTDRAMDHILFLRHQYDFNETYQMKTQFNYTKEYTRTGANEKWGTGLYDYGSYGLKLAGVRKFTPKLSTEGFFQYGHYNFPNYTDITEAATFGDVTGDNSVGLQDHTLLQPGIIIRFKDTKVNASYTNMAYSRQKVIYDTVQSSGSYYGGLQKDSIISFGIEHTQKIFSFLVIAPSLNYKIKDSNQNYLKINSTDATQTLASVTDLNQLDFNYFADYYDYNEYVIALPISVLLASHWEMFYSIEYDIKTYTKRPPKIGETLYDTNQKHKTDLTIMSAGFTFKPNPITRTTVFYTYQSQTSNLTYEGNQPYNYNGHVFGINLSYTY